jgi:putative ABC transport system permease protein
MTILNRKLRRELWQSRGQHGAIALVVASGVAVFVMALGVLGFLQTTRDTYYERSRFGDLFASLVRAPRAITDSLAAIDGVAAAETRIVADVTLDVGGLDEPAVGRLISVPDSHDPVLNRVHLVRGRWPDRLADDEVVAAEAFVKANHLQLGDSVAAVINSRYQRLRIVGIGLSPEYVFQIRGGDLLPDNRRFGVFWMGRRSLEAALDMDGAFNDLSIKLLRGSRPLEIVDSVDAILEPYGGVGAILRDDQISAKFLNEEIKQLRSTALVAPMIFLGVAAFLVNIVLTRKIAGDREQIAALRAFGYRGSQIAWHYLQTALVVSLAGAAIGAIVGFRMGTGLARLYSEFYRFPEFIYHADWRVLLPAIGISTVAAMVGALRSVMGVIRMQPAEAMRPPSPARYRRSWIEWVPLGGRLPLELRMILRHLGRRPLSSAMASLGISTAVAIMMVSAFAPDALDYLMRFQFETAQRQDIQVVFKDVRSADAIFELAQMPGVEAVEPFRAIPVELVAQHRHHRTSILGVGEQRDLYRLLDQHERPLRIPPGGVVLSTALADILHVQAGETITIRVREGEKPTVPMEVTALVTELAGTNAYMDLATLHRMMRESNVVSGAFMAVDSMEVDRLYQQLKRTPRVAAVTVKRATIDQFKESVSKNTLQMQSFTLFFAAVIAVGVVYNTARISLDERSRELATMRVIGFTRTEVSILLLGELAVLTLVAIPVGWVLGYAFCSLMVEAFRSEMFRIPLIILPSSYAKSAFVTLIAAGVSSLLVRRKLDHLDLVEVLKTRN